MPTVAIPVRARRGALGGAVRPTLDEMEASRVLDAYVVLQCPCCGTGHVLHTAESAEHAGILRPGQPDGPPERTPNDDGRETIDAPLDLDAENRGPMAEARSTEKA